MMQSHQYKTPRFAVGLNNSLPRATCLHPYLRPLVCTAVQFACPVILLFDVNFDGVLNVLDAVSIVNAIQGKSDPFDPCQELAADGNLDAEINVLDAVALVGIIQGKLPDPNQP